MELRFNLTGEARKALVKATGEFLGWEPVYKGAPSFAFVVANVTISKEGTLSWDERTDDSTIQNLLNRLRELRFIPEETENDSDEYCDTLTIEMPIGDFTEVALSNLDRLVASKATLIKKAFGINDIPIERTETSVKFPWFNYGHSADEMIVYTRFIGALCTAAKQHHRVTAKEKPVDNEKFAFRVFLIRLGLVGDEYKATRKMLLKNLTGNSAFKNGAPQKVTVSDDE